MSGCTGKKSLLGTFSITDRVSCEKAIRNGGIAAMISAGITAIFAGIGFFTSSSNEALAYLLDPWMAVDVVPIIILGVFIFRRSRIAATVMVLYFAVSLGTVRSSPYEILQLAVADLQLEWSVSVPAFCQTRSCFSPR